MDNENAVGEAVERGFVALNAMLNGACKIVSHHADDLSPWEDVEPIARMPRAGDECGGVPAQK